MTVNPGDRRRNFDQPPGNYTQWPPEELDFLIRVAARGVRENQLPVIAQLDLNTHLEYLLFEGSLRKIEEARGALNQAPQEQ